MLSKDNLNALLQILPEYSELTYGFFSEITPLFQVLKQHKPHALLVDGTDYNHVITHAIAGLIDTIPIIIFGNTTVAHTSNSQIYHLKEGAEK